MQFTFSVFLSIFLSVALPASSQIAYVTPYGAGTMDGTSWANAYDSKAFSAAVRTLSNTSFWVAAGSYLPGMDATGNTAPADPRDRSFSVTGSNIAVYGGFAGTETSFSQRNIRTNVTIFNGNFGNSLSGYSYHVWILNGATGKTILDGCTITEGYANTTAEAQGYWGGGVLDYSKQPLEIDSCIFVNNIAAGGGGGADIGGGGVVTMTNDVFYNNFAGAAGGPNGSGAGLQVEYGTQLTATQCIFYNNSAYGINDDGGGGLMVYEPTTTATLIQCTLLNNTTGSSGKPDASDVSLDVSSTLTLENTLIWGNEPAVIYATGATVTEQNSIVKGVYASPAWVTEAILFADSSNPYGADGQWRTADDGIGLRSCSPAINAGNNGFVTGTLDLADQPRIYNTTVDVGAYEFQAMNPVVVPAVTLSASAQPACIGAPVQFSTTNSGAGAPPGFAWSVNATALGDNTSGFSSSNLNNGDVVACTVTSTDACDYGQTATATVTMTVVPAASIAISANGAGACAGSPLSFTAAVTGGGNSPGLQWAVNGTATGDSVITYTSNNLNNGDAITCTLTPGTGACTTVSAMSNTIAAVVYPVPAASISPADTSVSYGTQVTLSAAASADVASWQWAPSGSTDPQLAVLAETAAQTYTLIVTTANNCSASATAVVKVYQTLQMPSGFTPNGDGHNDLFRIPPGVELNLQQLSVFDRWGNQVFATQNVAAGWNGTIGGHQAPAGTYVYVVVGSNDKGPVNIKGTVLLIR